MPSKNKVAAARLRGEHCLNVYISFELKDALKALAKRHDRTVADMVRAIIKIGIPVMEGLSQAEETMMREYIALFRKLRKVRALKDV